MKLGFIGLGKMGSRMVLNLLDHKHKPIVFNRSPEPTKQLVKKGAIPSFSIQELTSKLPKQKIIWLMVPAGKPVDQNITQLLPYLNKGDIIIDGGNSFYKDSIKRYNMLMKKGIHFLDCGTSGGIDGARHGACMMIGGDKTTFKKIEILFKNLTVKDGYGYMGDSGSGHFVKMVHNGIEYGMMGAIAEGLDSIRKNSKKTSLKEVAKVYSNGSIIESRLMSWTKKAIDTNQLSKIKGSVPKGKTEDEMKYLETISDTPILKAARKMRINSRKKPGFKGKVISAQRNQFGGHEVDKK
jgi:6-phosphogluconate dehydrogenase